MQQVPKGYKRTDVGVIPDDWQAIDLSEMCTLQRGFDLTEETRNPGSIPVYSSSGLSYFHDEAKANPPGVVTGRKGLLGKVFVVHEPFWPHDTTLWVKDFRGNEPAYVALVLESFHLERLDAATSVPTLNRNNLAGHRVPIPRQPEQRVIAKALLDAENLLEALDALIAKKRAIKHAAMQQLLTGRTRLPGFSGEWRTMPLEELFALVSTRNQELNDNVVTISAQQGFVRKEEFFSKRVASSSLANYYLIEKGHFAYNRSYSAGYPMGAIKRLKTSDKAVVTTLYICFAARDEGAAEPRFFEHYFEAGLLNDELAKVATEGGRAHGLLNITKADFFSRLVTFPSAPEQAAIATVLSDTDVETAALKARRDKTHAIKQGMMQQLLTGRARLVKPASAEADT